MRTSGWDKKQGLGVISGIEVYRSERIIIIDFLLQQPVKPLYYPGTAAQNQLINLIDEFFSAFSFG
jgi:hypothetical protein